MLVDDMLFEQEWFSELPLRLRFLYIYLLTKCTKVGVFEVNLRRISYDLNDGTTVTREDIFDSFGGRVKPLGESKGIFVDYVSFNWQRDKELDPEKNPLHRGLAQELSKYGLDFAKLNEMSTKHNLKWKCGSDVLSDGVLIPVVAVHKGMSTKKAKVDYPYEEWFNSFWDRYPGPRKKDKSKCHDKFLRILKAEKEPDHLFEKIMGGLNMWMSFDDWQKDGGRYICSPLVWLNNERWDAEIRKVGSNGSSRRSTTANANCQSTETDGLF